MSIRSRRSHLAARALTGAFILHTGIEKWRGDRETAERTHGMATTAYPFLGDVEPPRFLKLLAAGEVATGVALLAPVVPDRVAGVALTGFAASLLGLYFRVPGMHREGSLAPTPQGMAIAKDAWLLGIGLDLLTSRRAAAVAA